MFCVLAFVRLWQKEVRPHFWFNSSSSSSSSSSSFCVSSKKKSNQKRDRSNVKCQRQKRKKGRQKPIKPKNKKNLKRNNSRSRNKKLCACTLVVLCHNEKKNVVMISRRTKKMNALNIIEDNEATPNMDSSSRKRQRVTHKPSTTMTSPSALNLNNFKNLRQSTKSALKVYEDEEDGDKENRDPNVPSNRRYNSNSDVGTNKDLGGNEEEEEEKKKMRGNDFSSSEIQVSKVNMQIFRDNNERETKPSAPRAPFVTKLYSSLPKTGRVVLGDITRNYSPNRLVPGKYLIRPVSSSKGEENPQKRSEGGTNSNSSNNNRTSILKVR